MGRRVGDEGGSAAVDTNSPAGLFWAGLNESDYGRL
jgi:hypothetical protein